MGFGWFIVGFFVGGAMGAAITACIRLNKVEQYEEELVELERQLRGKK